MHKTISKKPVLKKSGFKPKQIIPKEKTVLIKNKTTILQTVSRISKRYSKTKASFSLMLDILNKSSLELNSLKKQLEKDNLYKGEIKTKFVELEGRRKQFFEKFAEFLEHSIATSKNPKLKDLDLMKFTVAEISANLYKTQFGEFLSKIVKLK